MRHSPLLHLLAGLFVGGLWLNAVPSAHAQSASDALFFSQRLPATGPRLMALGGASVAGVADYGALYSNPAGLGHVQTSEIAGTFQTLLTTDASSYETFRANETSFGTTTVSRSETGYGIANAALVYNVPTARGSLVFAGAFNETRVFDRQLDFQNQNELSSISDFFLPVNSEVNVRQFAPGEGPDELFFGQDLVVFDDAEYLVDFDPDGNGQINRPLSYIAFQTFGIDLVPDVFESGDPASAFLPVVTPGTQFQQVGDISESGGLREVDLGGSWEAAQGVMVGLSATIAFGEYSFRDVFEEIDTNNENDGTGGTVDLQRLRLTRSLDSDFNGFSLRGGVSADVAPNVRLGLAIETPTWYSIDETSSILLLTDFDNGDRFIYGDDPTEDVGRTRFDYEIRTPWRLSAGASGRVQCLRVMADVVFVDWTQLELEAADETGVFDMENNLIEDTFDPVVNARIGIEYALDDVAFRGGFAYQPAPVGFSELGRASFGTPSTLNLRGTDAVDDASRYMISAGVGYTFSEHFVIDITWAQQRFEDRTLPYVTQNASFVNEDVVRNHFLLGLRYRF